jgi:D-arabinose 1-dehydrogenase-like Zn-dependent alcohol dehydrogenase
MMLTMVDKDVLLCMGVVEATGVGIGLEGSGVITKVGASVSGLQPGDRVFYLADNCFSTQLTISAQRCAKIPSQLAFEDAATMPCVYATVIHSLLDVGGLRPGQSILIHSACGGIGIAALNLCRNIEGLEVSSKRCRADLPVLQCANSTGDRYILQSEMKRRYSISSTILGFRDQGSSTPGTPRFCTIYEQPQRVAVLTSSSTACLENCYTLHGNA